MPRGRPKGSKTRSYNEMNEALGQKCFKRFKKF